MKSHDHPIYQLGEFQMDPSNRLLTKGKSVILINDRAFDVLMVLLRNAGRIVTREEFLESVWRDVTVEPGNLDQSIFALRKALSDTSEPRRYIKTVPRRGFLFLPSVIVIDEKSVLPGTLSSHSAAQQSGSDISVAPERADEIRQIDVTHKWHVAVSCALYALLYALAIPLEVAYRWDRFSATAPKVALLVFLWVLVTSVGGLVLDRKLTSHGRNSGLIGSIVVFLMAAALLFGALSFFLPTFPITESTFQTYPAQAAYLKDMCYFLVLALIFLVVPYHFVAAVENEIKRGKRPPKRDERAIAPAGTPYLRPWALAVLLVMLLPISLYMSARLLDNLKPALYMNLFVELVYLRALLYFGLGMECLVWYQGALNEIKREGMRSEQA